MSHRRRDSLNLGATVERKFDLEMSSQYYKSPPTHPGVHPRIQLRGSVCARRTNQRTLAFSEQNYSKYAEGKENVPVRIHVPPQQLADTTRYIRTQPVVDPNV